jgi:hypothetical protein
LFLLKGISATESPMQLHNGAEHFGKVINRGMASLNVAAADEAVI